MTPDVYMIGGANGAGKTTAALTLLPRFLEVYELVNADEIARGLNPIQPDTADMMAGHIMIERIQTLVVSGRNFAFETTCAGRSHVKTLQQCKDAGYRLNLIFLWLPTPDMAVQRVAHRVTQGGHHVPEATIRRRYIDGLRNMLTIYLPMVEKAFILDSSNQLSDSYEVIAEKTADELIVSRKEIWQQIEKAVQKK